MSEKRLETLIEILNYSADLLKGKGADEARLNVELMLAEALNCSRMQLYMDFDKPLTPEEREAFKRMLKRRLTREPLQYIIGKTSFYGYEFKVTPDVLIPRPETELLVERVLNDIKGSGKSSVKIYEVGAGSGCISISIANELKKQNINFEIVSIDKSKAAIDIAEQNKKCFDIPDEKLTFETQDIFEVNKLADETDYLISNPPYIPKEEYEELQFEVRDYEPRSALTDEGNGLKFYGKLISLTDSNLKAFWEIAYNAKDKLTELLEKNSLKDFKFHKDYDANFRILEIN